MRRQLTVGLVLLVAALALVGASCGGDDEPEASSATEWADEFCTAVTVWTGELENIGNTLASSLSTDALEAAAADVSSATDAFVEDVRGLGAPDTESGQEIEDSVEALADSAEAEKAKIEEAVEDASGLTGAAAAAAVFGTSLSTMATAFETTLEAFEDADVDGELEAAFEEAPACEAVTG